MVAIGEVSTTKIEQTEIKGQKSSGAGDVTVDFGQNAGSNIDELSVNSNTTTQNQPKTKRTVNELYNSISATLKKYANLFSKEESLKLFERIAGVPLENVLYYDNSQIKNLLECLNAALKDLENKNQEINLDNLGELANDYNIAINTGWSIEGFREAQKTKKHESLKTRLERVYPNKSFEEALELYFTAYFDEQIANALKNAKTPEEAEKIRAKEKKRQLQDFGRLLANSSDEEMQLFKNAIKSLYADNRLKGFESLFKSIDVQEARTELADSVTVEYMEEISKTDRFGETTDAKDITGITHITAENQSEIGRKDFHEDFIKNATDFFETNKEIINRINQKLKNEEQLTPEEQAIKDKITEFYQAITAGEFTGTATNTVISEEAKTEILNTINIDAYNINNKYDDSFYSGVIKQVTEYAKEHENTLPENFNALIDEATNGNYSKILNNTSKEEPVLNAPKDQKIESTISVKEKAKSNFEVTTESKGPVDTTRLEEAKKAITNPIETVLPQTSNFTIVDAMALGNDAVEKYFQENKIKATKEVFNSSNKIKDKRIIELAYKTYEEVLSGKEQAEILMSGISGKFVRNLVKLTNDSALIQYCKDENANSWYATFIIKQKIKEIEKENPDIAK